MCVNIFFFYRRSFTSSLPPLLRKAKIKTNQNNNDLPGGAATVRHNFHGPPESTVGTRFLVEKSIKDRITRAHSKTVKRIHPSLCSELIKKERKKESFRVEPVGDCGRGGGNAHVEPSRVCYNSSLNAIAVLYFSLTLLRNPSPS